LVFDPDNELEAVVVLRSVEVRVDSHGRANNVDAALLQAAQRHQLGVRFFNL
jgi:hypothetical protein